MVHTDAAGAAGTELACDHVFPPSDVVRKVPRRSEAVLPPTPPCVRLPLTLTTQCVPSAQASFPTLASGIPEGEGTVDLLQWAPPSVVIANVARLPTAGLMGESITAQVMAFEQENA
jgi:hypothetical protein